LLYFVGFGLKETNPVTDAAEFCEADIPVLENTYFKEKIIFCEKKTKKIYQILPNPHKKVKILNNLQNHCFEKDLNPNYIFFILNILR